MATQPTSLPFVNQKSLRELTELLLRDAQIHEGLFDLSIEMQVSIGSFGPPSGEALPGALIGVKSVGLLPTTKPNWSTVDAGEVNPRLPRPRPAVKKSATRRKP